MDESVSGAEMGAAVPAGFNKVIFTLEYTDIVRKSASRSPRENPHCANSTAHSSPLHAEAVHHARTACQKHSPPPSNVLTFPSCWKT